MPGMGNIGTADGFIRSIHIVTSGTSMDMDVDEAGREEITSAINDFFFKMFWCKLFDVHDPFIFETDNGVLNDPCRKDHISFDKKIAHDRMVRRQNGSVNGSV